MVETTFVLKNYVISLHLKKPDIINNKWLDPQKLVIFLAFMRSHNAMLMWVIVEINANPSTQDHWFGPIGYTLKFNS